MTQALMQSGLESAATAAEIRAQVNLIQEVMQAVMKDGVHYGTIPGTPKPTLYKPGSEKILSTFHIAIEPLVEDLSIPGEEARFRVVARATHQHTFIFLGSGVGECSSNEEKYRWRVAVCDEEFDATPEDQRRTKYKKGDKGKVYTVKQIRTHPADIANTVLKMAKKRAQIDVCLTVTAASDVFSQDIEDLPDEVRDAVTEAAKRRAGMRPPERRTRTPKGELMVILQVAERLTKKQTPIWFVTVEGRERDLRIFSNKAELAAVAEKCRADRLQAYITTGAGDWADALETLEAGPPIADAADAVEEPSADDLFHK